MVDALDAKAVLALAEPLVSAGVAVHRLHKQSKRPVGDLWSTAPVLDFESLRNLYQEGENLGVRLGDWSKTDSGYLHLIDLDVRDPDQEADAWTKLTELWPEAKAFPRVVSGSGGASRHIYFFADRPFASRKLARSEGFSMVRDNRKGRDVKKFDWEIELFGTGKQAVIPPSIHPDTGQPYVWETPIDFDLVSLGLGPSVAASLPEQWGAWEDVKPADDDEDDLLSVVLAEPMGLSVKDAQEILNDLPDAEWCDDRDGWLNAGMALHHEFRGGEDGFKLWDEWSKGSEKYDEKDQKRVWKSFGEHRGRPIRMATLQKAATVARLETVCEEGDAGDISVDDLLGSEADVSDLLGDTPKPTFESLAAVKPEQVSVRQFDPEWRSYLQVTEDGAIKTSLHNVELIIRNDPRMRNIMAFNEFTQEVSLVAAPGRMKLKKESPKPIRQLDGSIWAVKDRINGDIWTDSHDNAIRMVVEAPVRQGGYALKVSDRDLRAAIDIVAHENAFHPVRDYLMRLDWDGIPRVENLFIDYLGTEDTPYYRNTAALTLVGAVTRVFEPGHKFDFVPILIGLQGKRKSTFAATLGRNERWFAELEGDFNDAKGMVEKMQGAWILELGELQGFSRSEVTTIKGFVSRRRDKVRLSYAKRATEFPRQCIFIGSTNEMHFLRDETGNRRFWPIHCETDEIDIENLERNVEQIWAEAVHMYRALRDQQPGGTLPLYLTDAAAREEAEKLQDSARVESSEENLSGKIEKWLDQPIIDGDGFEDDDGEPGKTKVRNETCVMEVWEKMLGRDLSALDQRNSQIIGRSLAMVEGWHSYGRAEIAPYGRQRVYRRKGLDPTELL